MDSIANKNTNSKVIIENMALTFLGYLKEGNRVIINPDRPNIKIDFNIEIVAERIE